MLFPPCCERHGSNTGTSPPDYSISPNCLSPSFPSPSSPMEFVPGPVPVPVSIPVSLPHRRRRYSPKSLMAQSRAIVFYTPPRDCVKPRVWVIWIPGGGVWVGVRRGRGSYWVVMLIHVFSLFHARIFLYVYTCCSLYLFAHLCRIT